MAVEATDLVAANKKSVIHVLHVDDDFCLLEVSKQIFSMENNFEIDNVICVDEAFRKMEKESFDAVVFDYEMPQKNGLNFLKELRKQENDVAFIIFNTKCKGIGLYFAKNMRDAYDWTITQEGEPGKGANSQKPFQDSAITEKKTARISKAPLRPTITRGLTIVD